MAEFQLDSGPVQAEAGIGFVGTQPVFGAQDNLTAATTHSIAGGTPITRNIVRFTTVANAGDAATLPAAFFGMQITLINDGANSMQVYGFQTADKINGIAGNTGISVMAGGMVNFICSSVSPSTGAAVWKCQDIGTGSSGNYPTLAYQTNLTAGTTQTAAGGTPITSSIAEFDTVANNNDAATLPPAQAGMSITVINNGGNTLKVFAATAALGGVGGGDTVNGSTSTTITTGTAVTLFFCTAQGKWLTK